MISAQLFLSFFVLLLASLIGATKPSSSNLLPHYKNGLMKQDIRSSASLSQLIITFPKSPLIANDTAPIRIDVIPPPLTSVESQLSIYCDNLPVFQVNSIIGESSDFPVPSNLIGNCTLIATAAPDYAPSDPLSVIILNPVYYEGDIDSVAHTGETIDVYMRAANDADIKVTLNISCDSGAFVAREYSTNQNNYFTLPPKLVGECVFSTPAVPQFYLPIKKFTVFIEPVILFVEPTDNQQYSGGTPIVAKLASTNDGNPNVVVTLTCNDTIVASQSKPLKSYFSFGPSQEIYGNCVLSVETSESYYAESTVNIYISNTLSFKSPTRGQPIGTGTEYMLEVVGSSGNGIVNATVVGRCQIGGIFEETVTLGVPKLVTMGQQFLGNCILTANVINAPNFPEATTNVVVLQTLTTEEAQAFAVSVSFFGGIISITR